MPPLRDPCRPCSLPTIWRATCVGKGNWVRVEVLRQVIRVRTHDSMYNLIDQSDPKVLSKLSFSEWWICCGWQTLRGHLFLQTSIALTNAPGTAPKQSRKHCTSVGISNFDIFRKEKPFCMVIWKHFQISKRTSFEFSILNSLKIKTTCWLPISFCLDCIPYAPAITRIVRGDLSWYI